MMLDFFAPITTRRAQEKGPRACRGFFEAFPPFTRFPYNLPEEK